MQTSKKLLQPKTRIATRLQFRLVCAVSFSLMVIAGWVFVAVNLTQNTKSIARGNDFRSVELMYFRAREDDGNVRLSWATSSEINNNSFVVERSPDGENYSEILRQKSAGDKQSVITYTDKDEQPLTMNYYRLKQIDNEGKFSFSPVVTVKMLKNKSFAKLKTESVDPNPFSDRFNIAFTSAEDAEAEVMLMNMTGQTIHREKLSVTEGHNNYEFSDNQNLQPGTYVIMILSRDSKLTEKIIKY